MYATSGKSGQPNAETAYRQEIKETARIFLPLANVALPRPAIPSCNIPRHGHFGQQVGFSELVEDAPERLDFSHPRCLDCVDLAEIDKGAVAFYCYIQGGCIACRAASVGRLVSLCKSCNFLTPVRDTVPECTGKPLSDRDSLKEAANGAGAVENRTA